MKIKARIALLLSLAVVVLTSTAFAALPTNDALNTQIKQYQSQDLPFDDAVATVAEDMLRDSLTAIPAGTLTQDQLSQIVFDIAKRCRELQDAGLMGSDILFEDVFAGILNGSQAVQGFNVDIPALEVAAMNGWGTVAEPEAFERAQQKAFQVRARNMNRHGINDVHPASPQ